MITKNGELKCDECGKFVGYNELKNKTATHKLIYPDSEFTKETWETHCHRCSGKEVQP